MTPDSTQSQLRSRGRYKWWIHKTCQSKGTETWLSTARQGTATASGIDWVSVANSIHPWCSIPILSRQHRPSLATAGCCLESDISVKVFLFWGPVQYNTCLRTVRLVLKAETQSPGKMHYCCSPNIFGL